jgi:hypothetical protein
MLGLGEKTAPFYLKINEQGSLRNSSEQPLRAT